MPFRIPPIPKDQEDLFLNNAELSQLEAKKRVHRAVKNCERLKAAAEAHALMLIRQSQAR